MVVNCKTCGASYHIYDERLESEARAFRCASCGEARTILATPMLNAKAESRHPGQKPAVRRTERALSGSTVRLGDRFRSAAPLLAGLAAIGVAMAALGARGPIAAASPVAARGYALLGMPVNSRGAAIEGVKATTTDVGDKKVLLIAGEIVNLRAGDTALADLRISLRAADGRELYVWTTRAPKDRLAAGERTQFRARLASPPEEVRDALVKFAGPGDKASFTEAGT